MSIYGTCKLCGQETKDYECLNCLRGKLFALEAVADAARAYLRGTGGSQVELDGVGRHNLQRALDALEREGQAAE